MKTRNEIVKSAKESRNTKEIEMKIENIKEREYKTRTRKSNKKREQKHTGQQEIRIKIVTKTKTRHEFTKKSRKSRDGVERIKRETRRKENRKQINKSRRLNAN